MVWNLHWIRPPRYPFILVQRCHIFLEVLWSALPFSVHVNGNSSRLITWGIFQELCDVFLSAVTFVISLAICYLWKDKAKDSANLHNNVIGLGSRPHSCLHSQKEANQVTELSCPGAKGVGSGWELIVALERGGIRPGWSLSHLRLYLAHCMVCCAQRKF